MACPLTPPYVFNSACSDDDKIQLKRRGDFADKVFLKKFKVLPSADSSDSESCSETEIRPVSQRQRSVSATKLRRRRSFAPSSDVQARQRCLEYLVSAIDEVWARFCACTSFAEDQHYAYDMPSPKQDVDEDDEEIEDSGKLQALKERLTKAKYYLQDLSDVADMDASVSFWNRWDLVKYAVIEFVEDNGEEDDVIEGVCSELEEGRL